MSNIQRRYSSSSPLNGGVTPNPKRSYRAKKAATQDEVTAPLTDIASMFFVGNSVDELSAKIETDDDVVSAAPTGFVFVKSDNILEHPEDYRPIATSWNVRQCEVSLTKLYEKLSDTINGDPELRDKANKGFMTSLYAKKDMSTATLLNTAFKSGLQLVANGKDEEGNEIKFAISSTSQLSSILFGLTDSERFKEVAKATQIAKATLEKLVNSPGNASASTLLRTADASGISLSFESK